MAKIKIPEILEKLEKDGLGISKRTFQYYQWRGFLPKPEMRVGEKGRGVYGFYDYETIRDLVLSIRDMKAQSLTLADIAFILSLGQPWRI